MIVSPNKLTEWNQNGFDLNEAAERRICEMVFQSPVAEVSTGNSPEWDVRLENGTTVEVKFTNSKDIFIETHYADGRPSGLNLSTADYYVVVHKGYWAAKGGSIGKVKVFRTSDLRAVADKCTPRSYSAGSGFMLGRQMNSIETWIGNLDYDVNEQGYDLSHWQYGKAVHKI